MRIAIIGFGFAGNLTLANLVRHSAEAHTVYVIAPEFDGRGVAYSTENPEHLLNVRAKQMGAFADEVGGFYAWLSSDAARVAMRALGLSGNYSGEDFVPRALYGAYLHDIWQQTQAQTAQKNFTIKLVPSEAVAIQPGHPLSVLTARGDAIEVDKAVLCVGHEPKLVGTTHAQMVQDIWAADVFAGAREWFGPVMIMGLGLTSIDVLLSLRRAGYHGLVLACSRRGLMPQPHRDGVGSFTFPPEMLAQPRTLSKWMQCLREVAEQSADWRMAVDGLRPHTQALWQRFDLPTQERFLQRVLPFWNIHRHRMAPEIAAKVEDELAQGRLQLVQAHHFDISTTDEGKLQVVVHRARQQETYFPTRIFNCTGLEQKLARQANPLLRQMLSARLVEAHGTGLGITVDPHLRAWGGLYPHLYAMGSLLSGQLLESTAVPELRTQAQMIAKSLVAAG